MGQVLSVFYLALFMLLLTSFGSLAIPESNHQAGKVTSIPSLWERMNVFSAVKIVFQIKLVHVTPYALSLVNLIGFLLATVMLPPVLLYGMLRFGWTAYEGSIYVSILCITRLFVMAVVLPLCTRWWSSSTGRIRFNLWLVRIGCLFEVIHMLLIGGLVNDDKQFVAAGALGSLASLAHPALRSLLTTLVSPADVGKVLGVFAALDAFGSKLFLSLSFFADFCPLTHFIITSVDRPMWLKYGLQLDGQRGANLHILIVCFDRCHCRLVGVLDPSPNCLNCSIHLKQYIYSI